MQSNTEHDARQVEREHHDERIRLIAYSIWEEEGRPEGCADDHWHRATAIFEAQFAIEQMREPDWLKRGAGAMESIPGRQTTGEPAGVVLPKNDRRTAA